MDDLATGPFDRDFELGELLSPEQAAALVAALGNLLGAPVCLRDARERVIAGPATLGGIRAAVRGTLEPLGSLQAAAPEKSVEAAALVVERVARTELRYRMASSLHTEAVQADFERLQEQHRALQASETRYRELSEHLETRVLEQVRELESAQRSLYQAEKLAAVGQLAAGMAHEINTPLGFIRSNLNTARRYCGTLEEVMGAAGGGTRAGLEELFADFHALLDESIDGADRVARIVAALKEFSQVDRQGTRPTDLNVVVANAIAMVRPQGMDRVEFEADLSPLPPVTCDAGKMGQVFLSLLTNAVQAIERRGTVRVVSGVVAGGVSVVVEDDGAGIAAGDLDRVFEPFFSTRDVGQGTGLGLTVSKDIVRGHGGHIEIASRHGSGTRVAVFLPVDGMKGAD